jgi:hypothetical protein
MLNSNTYLLSLCGSPVGCVNRKHEVGFSVLTIILVIAVITTTFIGSPSGGFSSRICCRRRAQP